MLLKENALRTIINTLLKEGQSFESFLADAEAEVAKTGSESKLIILDEAAAYLDVEDYDELKDFIANKIDVRSMRKFDDFILKVLYSLYSIDAGIDNWENLIPILENLYKKNNLSITKSYNDLLLKLNLIDVSDTRDIPSKIIKSNLPGAGKDSNGIPKSSIVMFAEMYPDEYNNGFTLLDKLVQGVASIVDFKTYAGYSVDLINKNVSNGNWIPVLKENNITIFKLDGYDAVVSANNIYDFKTAYNRVITKKDTEIIRSQHLDNFIGSHYLTDLNVERNVRQVANWCVKDDDSYNAYLTRSNTSDGQYDYKVDNEFYLILNNNLPVDSDDGACLALALNSDKIKDSQVSDAVTGYLPFDEYIGEHFYEAKNLKDIIHEAIIPYNHDVFYYGNYIGSGNKKVFAYYDVNEGGFCLIQISSGFDIIDSLLELYDSELEENYLKIDDVSLKLINNDAYRLYKDMFVVNKEMFRNMTEAAYFKTIKKAVMSRDVSENSIISMLTWDAKLRQAMKAYLSADKGMESNIAVPRKFNKFIDQLLNFDDNDLQEEELYTYIELFEKLGIGCINSITNENKQEAPALQSIIEGTDFYKNNQSI